MAFSNDPSNLSHLATVLPDIASVLFPFIEALLHLFTVTLQISQIQFSGHPCMYLSRRVYNISLSSVAISVTFGKKQAVDEQNASI